MTPLRFPFPFILVQNGTPHVDPACQLCLSIFHLVRILPTEGKRGSQG